MRLLFPVIVLALLSGAAFAQTPAFPGCQGSGCTAIGGRGGTVIKVTNTNDNGAGSLRACMEGTGARICVFETGGTIDLETPITVTSGNLTVAGQTAPGGGIQLDGRAATAGENIGHAILVDANDTILRYLRIRIGDDSDSNQNGDGVQLREGTHVVDHMSIYYTTDEHLQCFNNGFAADCTGNVTFSNNIIAEPMEAHPTNVQISAEDRTTTDLINDVDVIRNYMANSSHRNPLVGVLASRIVNNVVYNYRFRATQIRGTDLDSGGTIDIEGNLYKEGPEDLTPSREIAVWADDETNFTLFVEGNKGFHHADPDTDNWDDMVWEADPAGGPNGDLNNVLDETTFRRVTRQAAPAEPIAVLHADGLENVILPDVGASRRLDCDGAWVFNRDSVDTQAVQDFADGTGAMPASNADATWPTLAAGAACTDTDGDGVPDDFENRIGTDPNVADATGDLDADGYDNIEEWINGPAPCHLIDHGDVVPTAFGAPFDAAAPQRMLTRVFCNDAGAQVWVGDGASDLEIYDTAWFCDGVDVAPGRYLCDQVDWQTVALSGTNLSGDYFTGRAWSPMVLTKAEVEDAQRDVMLVFVCEATVCGFQAQVFRR